MTVFIYRTKAKISVHSKSSMTSLHKEVPEESIPEVLGGKFSLWNEPYDFDLSVGGPLYFDGLPQNNENKLLKKLSVMPPPSSHDTHAERIKTIKCRRWSEEEEQKLLQMRTILDSVLKDIPQCPDVVGDRRLLRFLRGHNMDVAKAAHMFRNFIEYRKKHNVDEIRDRIRKS